MSIRLFFKVIWLNMKLYIFKQYVIHSQFHGQINCHFLRTINCHLVTNSCFVPEYIAITKIRNNNETYFVEILTRSWTPNFSIKELYK